MKLILVLVFLEFLKCFLPLLPSLIPQHLFRAAPTPAAPDLVVFFFFFFTASNFTSLVLGVRNFRCCAGFSPVGESGGCSLMAIRGLFIAPTSLVKRGISGAWATGAVIPRLWSTGSAVVAHGLGCPGACVIFSDHGSNPYLPRWQVDSVPLSHQGSPDLVIF